jgi:membrane protease YdiL (CAAX protease family)
MLGMVSGWARERTNSVWPSVVGHNLSNIVIPVATLVHPLICAAGTCIALATGSIRVILQCLEVHGRP